jgi:hypothetical protein
MFGNGTGLKPVNRRTVLETIGGTAALSVGGAASVSGTERRSIGGRVAGVTYDTLTHQTGKPAVGRVTSNSNGLQGNLQIAGYSIPLDSLETQKATKPDHNYAKYYGDLNQREFQQDELSLRVRILEHEDHLSGILSRPSTRFGELGFYVVNEESIDVREATASKSGDSKWKNMALRFNVPDEGLPTDSATRRLHEINDTEARNGGDR